MRLWLYSIQSRYWSASPPCCFFFGTTHHLKPCRTLASCIAMIIDLLLHNNLTFRPIIKGRFYYDLTLFFSFLVKRSLKPIQGTRTSLLWRNGNSTVLSPLIICSLLVRSSRRCWERLNRSQRHLLCQGWEQPQRTTWNFISMSRTTSKEGNLWIHAFDGVTAPVSGGVDQKRNEIHLINSKPAETGTILEHFI